MTQHDKGSYTNITVWSEAVVTFYTQKAKGQFHYGLKMIHIFLHYFASS